LYITNVSEELTASIFRVEEYTSTFYPEDGIKIIKPEDRNFSCPQEDEVRGGVLVTCSWVLPGQCNQEEGVWKFLQQFGG
jgi:hypothetical protein